MDYRVLVDVRQARGWRNAQQDFRGGGIGVQLPTVVLV
jgi:hypothetical protein